MMVYVGIDPGISGGICVHPGSYQGVPEFFDTPTLAIRSGKKIKNVPDAYAIATLLQGISAGKDVMVTIEKVNAMPSIPGADGQRRSMGATSAFSFGYGFGIWIGVLSALRIPHQMVHPMTWKKSLMSDMGKEKDASRIKAMQMFPFSSKGLARKMDHGRADALLLAEWGKRNYSPRHVENGAFELEGEQLPF